MAAPSDHSPSRTPSPPLGGPTREPAGRSGDGSGVRPAGPGAVSSTRRRRALALAERRPILLVWIGTVFFSASPVIIASATTISGPAFAFYRLWFGAVLTGGLALANHRRLRSVGGALLTRTGVRWTIASGAAFAVHQLMFIAALRTTSVVDVTLMNTLAPVIVAVLAVPLFGERPGLSFRLWSVLAIVGAALVAVAGSSGPQGQPVGVALAAGNVVFYSLYFVGSKEARAHIDTITFLAGTVLVAAIVVSAYVVITGTSISTVSGHDLLLCATVAAIPGLLGHFSITWSLKWVPANIPPIIMLAVPLLSGLLAFALLGQIVTALKIVGGLVTLVGVAGAVRSPGARTLSIEALDLAEQP